MASSGEPTEIRVFLASPNIPELRHKFAGILDTINAKLPQSLGVMLHPVMWEQMRPGVGRSQELINRDLSACDLGVIVFGDRWGNPSGEFTSGTEEEFFQMITRKNRTGSPEILAYFKKGLKSTDSQDAPRILNFQQWIQNNFALFYYTYDSTSDLLEAVEKHISGWLRENRSGQQPDSEVPKHEHERKLLEAARRQAQQALGQANRGLKNEALELFRSALATFQDPEIINQYATCLIEVGRLNEAEKELERAITISRHDSSTWVNARCNTAKIRFLQGNPRKAEKILSDSLVVAEQIGRPSTVGRVHQSFTEMYIIQGKLQLAKDSTEKAARAYLLAGNLLELAWAVLDMGVLLLKADLPEQAQQYLEAALEHSRQAKSDETVAKVLINIGRMHESRDEFQQAEEVLGEAIAICRSHGIKQELAGALSQLAHVREGQDRVPEAAKIFTEALALEEELDNYAGMAHNNLFLAIIYGAAQQLDRAREHAAKAVQFYEAMNAKKELELARQTLKGIEKLRERQ